MDVSASLAMDDSIDPRFSQLLAASHFSVEGLAGLDATVIGMWPDGRIAYLNDAWKRFADENGGQPTVSQQWGLGTNYFQAIPEQLRPFYAGLFSRASEPDESLHPVAHAYECSSPTSYRVFNMHVYALQGRAGFIVVNSLVVERPHDPVQRPAHDATEGTYRDINGIVHQCSHCRRIKRPQRSEQWDWVPIWVRSSAPQTSHGLCPICESYYYP